MQSLPQSILEPFQNSKYKSPIFGLHSSTLSSFSEVATHSSTSVSMKLPILDTSYKWNYTTCGLLYQESFTWHNVFKVHQHGCMHYYFIAFYGWILLSCMDILECTYPFIICWVFGLKSEFLKCSVFLGQSGYVNFIDLFKELPFYFVDFLYCMYILGVIDFHSNSYSLPYAGFEFSLLFFFQCLKVGV